MTPSIGRIVIVPVRPEMNNGADRAPAVITRVWGADDTGLDLINVRVLCDSENLLWKTSIRLYPTEEAALDATVSGASHFAYWPPRV